MKKVVQFLLIGIIFFINSCDNNKNSNDSNPSLILSKIKSEDYELQNILNESIKKFKLLTYEGIKGETLDYYLFVPENYSNVKLPILIFIPDRSVVGRENEYSLTQGYGAGVWVKQDAQEQNPSIVFVPIFTEVVVNDDFEVSKQVDLVVDILNDLANSYLVDKNRIYITGQSMGGMTSFHLNLKYPDLFAASLFVGCQWNTEIMLPLKDKKFFYIVAEGDAKAYKGQKELKHLFDKNNVKYSTAKWSAKLNSEEQNANVNKMIAEGKNINFVTFTQGTTYPEGFSGEIPASEHMTSFDFAYKIVAIQQWLFRQTK